MRSTFVPIGVMNAVATSPITKTYCANVEVLFTPEQDGPFFRTTMQDY